MNLTFQNDFCKRSNSHQYATFPYVERSFLNYVYALSMAEIFSLISESSIKFKKDNLYCKLFNYISVAAPNLVNERAEDITVVD